MLRRPHLAALLLAHCLLAMAPAVAQKVVSPSLSAEVFGFYKTIHQSPELGKQEYKTAKFVKEKLTEFGYRNFFTVKSLPTAVIAILDTKVPGPVIALRSELDGRPGIERSNLPYAARDTTMHSCGHDAHTASLLGAAKLLMQNKAKLKGKIVLVFQPAEETPGGADDIVDEGVLKTLGIQKMFTMHSMVGLPVGSITVESGYFLAGSNYFTIGLSGRGSHAAVPYIGSDIPVLAAQLVNELTSLPSRHTDVSMRPAVISVSYIATGDPDASNVIPDSATLKGTIRTYDPIDSAYAGQPSLRGLINQRLESFARRHQVRCNATITAASPPTYNDPQLLSSVLPKLRAQFSGQVVTENYRGMFAEDFSYYTAHVPCLYFGLGIQKEQLGTQSLHTPLFTIHPDALAYGVELFYWLAVVGG